MSYSDIFQKLCPICGMDQISKNFTYKDRHYLVTEKDFDVWKCTSCRLFFLNPIPSMGTLMSLYPKTYYSFHKLKTESATKKLLVKLLNIEPSDLNNIPNSSGEKILDFGCGSGWSLDLFKQNGFETYGVELDDNAVKIASENGHFMSNKDLLETNYSSVFFDYIRSNHSLEHVTNPMQITAEFHRILKPGGKLFISVPNANSLTRNIFGKYWYYTGVPYHVFNYSAQNLIILLEKNGFIVDHKRYSSGWQGIFGSLAIISNRNTKKKSLDSFLSTRPFRMIGIVLSKFCDLISKGDCIEIYATKKN